MTSLAQAFEAVVQRLDLTPGQVEQATDRGQRLVTKLQGLWGTTAVKPIGSVARGTAVPPIHDVDIMFVRGEGAPTQKPIEMITDVYATLQREYPGTGARPQNRSVGLLFTDFGIDVVPAFARPGGGYKIPDVETNAWIDTDPTVHASYLVKVNDATGGKAARIVKLLKAWNSNKQIGLKSFHLEVMALRAIAKAPPASYAEGLRAAFDALASAMDARCPDPASDARDLGLYLHKSARRPVIAKACREAGAEVALAIAEEARGASGPAVNRVRTLIGSPF